MDDFSFPAIQTKEEEEESFPRFATSQIWYRRSFSSAEEAAKVADRLSMFSPALSDSGENMDMLWEDFNDELKKKDLKYESVKPASVEELRAPKRKSSLRSRKKPGLIVMLKVLKKLFLVQKSNGLSKKDRDMRCKE